MTLAFFIAPRLKRVQVAAEFYEPDKSSDESDEEVEKEEQQKKTSGNLNPHFITDFLKNYGYI